MWLYSESKLKMNFEQMESISGGGFLGLSVKCWVSIGGMTLSFAVMCD